MFFVIWGVLEGVGGWLNSSLKFWMLFELDKDTLKKHQDTCELNKFHYVKYWALIQLQYKADILFHGKA